MSDVATTEITELDATKVSGVGTPANGIPFILIKAAAEKEDCSTCKGTGKILAGNRDCPDCKGGEVTKSDSDEADAIEDEVTGEASKEAEEWDALDKALSAAERDKMPASSFAFIDKNGKKHLPVHDEGHTIAAKGRVSQQDFSEAKGDPADAKTKAESKIAAAAKKFGIGDSAKKGAVQDGLNGTATPEVAGHLDSGKSGASGSVARGTAPTPADASLAVGGRSTAEIPVEAKVTDNPPIPATTDGAGIIEPGPLTVAKAVAVASLWDALDHIEATRVAVKEGKFLQAQGDAALVPGSVPWESFDAANLKQIAEMLAGCCSALDYMAQREREESMSADPGDIENAWDLEEAGHALDYAMGVVARLSFHEAVEGEATKSTDEESVTKVGRKLSGKTESALRTARDHLNEVIAGAENNKAGSSGDDDKEIDMGSITKGELAEAIVVAVRDVKKQEKAERKEAKKKAAEEEAAKNANNGGDIAEGDIKPTSEHDSDDIQSVGGSPKPEYVNKGADEDAEAGAEMDPAVKQVSDQLTELTKGLASVEETVAKIAKKARPVGPVLDGQGRGTSTAEGRQGELAKSGVTDSDIEELQKALDAETDPARKSQIAEELTYANLVKHYGGQLGR